jgi:hypothetical protein
MVSTRFRLTSIVEAPFDGVITLRNVDSGKPASAPRADSNTASRSVLLENPAAVHGLRAAHDQDLPVGMRGLGRSGMGRISATGTPRSSMMMDSPA